MKVLREPGNPASTASAPCPSVGPAVTGTARMSTRALAGAVDPTVNEIGTNSSSDGGSVIAASGAVVAFLPTAESPAQVGEPVEVRHDLTVGLEPAAAGRGDARPLGAAGRGASDVEGGRDPVLARQHELERWVEPGGDVVDDRFERLHHRRGHAGGAVGELATVVGRGRQLGA